MEGLDGDPSRYEEGVRDETERTQVHFTLTGRNKLGEAPVEARIFAGTFQGAFLAVDEQPAAAFSEPQRSAVGLHDDIPGLWSGLEKVEIGGDGRLADRKLERGRDRRMAPLGKAQLAARD